VLGIGLIFAVVTAIIMPLVKEPFIDFLRGLSH
jgi:hypothetical protein